MNSLAASSAYTFCYSAEHPVFAGHFPGQPVLPGVLLLAEVMRGVRASPAWQDRLGAQPEIVSAKFHAPLAPGRAAEVRLQSEGSGARFEIHAAAQLVASGQVRRGGAS